MKDMGRIANEIWWSWWMAHNKPEHVLRRQFRLLQKRLSV